MNISFDFYEYAAIIVPGSVFAFCGLLIFPELQSHVGPHGVSFGELGIFVVISYALGQLVQGVGNTIEWLWWLPGGGLPSNRVLQGETLTDRQHQRLLKKIEADGLVGTSISKETAGAISREVYVRVASANQNLRIDKFSGIYGMLRGLSASLIALTLIASITGVDWRAVVFLVCSAVISLRRMHRFGWHYAKELVVTYLSLEPDQSPVK